MANKKVRLIAQVSGTRNGEDWPKPGEFMTVSEDEANDLIRTGIAIDPGAEKENAIADALGVEYAADLNSESGQKSIRTQLKPAPHADEPDAYHNPPVAGEQAAAEAGQKVVDEANADLIGAETVKETKPARGRKAATDK